MESENCTRITIADMAPHVHTFLPNENKVAKITNWLAAWITKSIEEGKIKPYDFLPPKGELAFHVGVSLGTIQNVFRNLEDIGLIESRQRIGAYIKNPKNNRTEKLTSKRDVAIETIKKYILEQDYKEGDALESIRALSAVLNISIATIRTALDSLIEKGIIEKQHKSFIIRSTNFKIKSTEQQTLVEKIAEKINLYIKENLSVGDKLPANSALADMFNVSIKTIHDSIKILSLAGIVKTRRGYYGTIVINQKEDNNQYYYEQVEESIKKYIAENCKIGTKLPSIKDFSEVFNVSTKTIKNAFDNLSQEGFINSVRGKFGGTYVTDLPIIYKKGFTWLALDSKFMQKE